MNENTPVTTIEHLLEALRLAGIIAGQPVVIGVLAAALAKAPLTTMATSLEAQAAKDEQNAQAAYAEAMAAAAAKRQQSAEYRSKLAV